MASYQKPLGGMLASRYELERQMGMGMTLTGLHHRCPELGWLSFEQGARDQDFWRLTRAGDAS